VKINDAVTGAALVALGLVILWHIQGYPEMQGQKFGPAWFPGIVAAGLAICGAILVARGVRSGAPLAVAGEWTRRPRPLAGFVAVIAGLALYVVLSNPLGFHLTGFLLLLAWLRILGARWTVSIRSPSSRRSSSTSPSTSCCASRSPGACSSASRFR
jgi:putative tricarboxylic transport membrane protein